jgi:hypothetical protein
MGKQPFWFLYKISPHVWLFGVFVLLLDLLGIPEIYETVVDIIKWRTRPLSKFEIEHCKLIFGQQIDWYRVRIDHHAFAGPKQLKIAYVSFYTINCWGDLSLPTLIHEVTHIWQFEHFGSLYIPLALQAQMSVPSYNYGGVNQLCHLKDEKFHVAFNFEQQADIVEDYYRSQSGLPLQWSSYETNAEYWLRYWIQKGIWDLG